MRQAPLRDCAGIMSAICFTLVLVLEFLIFCYSYHSNVCSNVMQELEVVK